LLPSCEKSSSEKGWACVIILLEEHVLAENAIFDFAQMGMINRNTDLIRDSLQEGFGNQACGFIAACRFLRRCL
jgi:hypothetical protein